MVGVIKSDVSHYVEFKKFINNYEPINAAVDKAD